MNLCWVYLVALGFGQVLPIELPQFCSEHGLPYGALLEGALTSGGRAPLVQAFAHGEQLAFFARIGGHCILATADRMLYTMSGAGELQLQQSPLVQAMVAIAQVERPLVVPAMRKMLEIVTQEFFTHAGVPCGRPVRVWLRGRYGTASATLNALAGDGAALHKMLTVGGLAEGGQQYREARQVR